MPVLIGIATFLVLASPVVLALLRVIAAGDYTTQTVLWRSSPSGADLLTLILGHPRHVLTGELDPLALRRARDRCDGAVAVDRRCSAADPRGNGARVALRARRRGWILAAVVFTVLALGPFLRIGGLDTALPLPDAVLRYVPVFSNARIPGRAVVVVQLAVAVLLAYALVRRAAVTAILLVVLVAAEAFPARLPLSVLPSADAVDDLLRTSSSPGAVAELPLGLRDGFVTDGAFDHRALVHQMFHGRALTGGFVARLAPAVREVYADTAILSSLVRLSTPSASDYRLDADAAAQASAAGIAFVVLNRDTFIDARLPRSELERTGFRFVQASGPRELYETAGPK